MRRCSNILGDLVTPQIIPTHYTRGMSVCDNIGLHVSKQIKGKIIKEEYVELENLLPVSLSDSNPLTYLMLILH
jgi:hypothetical protein